jgi:hypothetical protein
MRPTSSTTAQAAGVIAVVVGLFSTGGHTGRTHYEDVTLETMVQQSTLGVVVHPADPATVIAELPLEGQMQDGSPAKPFRHTVHRFVVDEVVAHRQAGPGPAPGAVIEVEGANLGTQLTVYSLYQLEGIHKSPIYERYLGGPTTADPKEPRRIVFLNTMKRADGTGTGYRFVVDDAVESLAALPKVRALLQKQSTRAPPLEPND